MTLRTLKQLLADHPQHLFRLRLPDTSDVPVSFHVTEVGRIDKTFLDCGGTRREKTTCQLQVWVGQDFEHRIETQKMVGILKMGEVLLPDDSVPVEIEYEDRVISQYTIEDHEVSAVAITLQLAHKHTECLAPELCGLDMPSLRLPSLPGQSTPCCAPGRPC